MTDLVGRALRELPDTDKDRYDVAYARGRAQARSVLLFGGLAVGAVAGAAATFLFDPERGKGRRDELARQLTGRFNGVSQTVEGRSRDLRNRAQGFAIEHGMQEPPAEPAHEQVVAAAPPPPPERAWESTEAVTTR